MFWCYCAICTTWCYGGNSQEVIMGLCMPSGDMPCYIARLGKFHTCTYVMMDFCHLWRILSHTYVYAAFLDSISKLLHICFNLCDDVHDVTSYRRYIMSVPRVWENVKEAIVPQEQQPTEQHFGENHVIMYCVYKLKYCCE